VFLNSLFSFTIPFLLYITIDFLEKLKMNIYLLILARYLNRIQGRLQRGKWTQLASSLAQGGKNSTLKGGIIPPDIWVILMIVL